MNITVKTANIVIDDKSTALTKAIVKQLPMVESEYINNDRFSKGGDCEVLGEVEIDNGRHERVDRWIIVNTPRGPRRVDEHVRNALNTILHRDFGTCIERIILIK